MLALILIGSYTVAEVVGGLMAGSLALLADAGHMLTDAAAIALALAATHFAARPASAARTFGYRRLEILAALVNVAALWAIAGYVAVEAYRRFAQPPDVDGVVMLVVGGLGLLVNLAAARLLHRSAKRSINVAGAFWHVLADLAGSLAVVVSGGCVLLFGWTLADALVSVLISVLIVVGTWRLLGRVVHILLEGTPEHIDVASVCQSMEALPQVTGVHDIHIWTLSPGYEMLTAHVLAEPPSAAAYDSLLRQLRHIAAEDFGIEHVTIQLETSAQDCAEDHHLEHLLAPAHSR